jgi:hypothetical protein
MHAENEVLYCIIKDDGIGRKKAAELKSRYGADMHKSMGVRITEERIAMLQQHKELNTAIFVKDLMLHDGTAGGTEVILKIPITE